MTSDRINITAPLRNLCVEYRAVAGLRAHLQNARTHSGRQIRQIAESIKTFGFTNPILVDAKGGIVAGHGRVAAAKRLGIKEVPTIRLDEMSEAQKRAYALADNRLAENAGWDQDLLALELQYITDLDIELDVTVTGFDAAEIDILLDGSEGDPEADTVPEVAPSAPTITREGDLWRLGRHRLLCADARSPSAYRQLLGKRRAQMVFADPPYNVPIAGHVSGLGRVRHAEFVMASGEMSEGEFTAFLNTVFVNLTAHSVDGSVHFACMDWRHAFELLTAARKVYELMNVCIWNKSNGGMGGLYRSKHEFVFVLRNGSAPHVNNVQLGRSGRNRTNVWDYPAVSRFRREPLDELSLHPTVKPVALVADAIKDCSKRRGLVLDPFVGSGSTMIAAEKTGRVAYGLELDPRHVDTAIRRWAHYAGEPAIHDGTGLTADQLATQRSAAPMPPQGG